MTKYRFNNVDFDDFDALRPALAAHLGVDSLPPVAVHGTHQEGEAPGSGGIYFMPPGGWRGDRDLPAFTYRHAEGVRVVTPA